MSDEEKMTSEAAAGTAAADEQVVEPPYGDEHTTEPNAQDQQPTEPEPGAPGKWEMPKPVFQKTSGYLPQGFVKDFEASAEPEGDPSVPDEIPSRPPAKEHDLSAVNISAPAAAAVEPQPDLSEQFIHEEPEFEAVTETPKKSGSVGISMVVLGVIAILAFVAIFLAVIIYLFFPGSGDTNPF